MDAAQIETPLVANGADVEMKEEPGTNTAAIPPFLPQQLSTNEPVAPSVSTPTPVARNSPAQSAAPPSEARPHGSPTRVYLNQSVTPHLLEAMKYLAVHEPEKPLKWLSEFLAQRSGEVEGV